MAIVSNIVKMETRILLKSKIAVFWTFAFPILFMVMQARLNSASTPADLSYIVSCVLALVIVSTSLMGFSATLVQAREIGFLGNFSLWPARKSAVLAALALSRVFIILMSAAMLIAIALLFLDASPPSHLIVFCLFLFFSIASLLVFGVAVGARLSEVQSGGALANLLYFGLIFLGEIFFKAEELPPMVAEVFAWLPVNAVVHGLDAAWVGTVQSLIQPVIALSVFAAISALYASKKFLWFAARVYKLA